MNTRIFCFQFLSRGGGTAPIYIGSGTWVGLNAVILPGTVVGKGCVIAANCVVKGEFPDYCVIAGVPGKIIKIYKDSEWKRVKETWV